MQELETLAFQEIIDSGNENKEKPKMTKVLIF